ncbi:sterile alpha motif domain-containing protein 3-like isoform X2 [Pseudorasbora parva]|uniref:sterile alpha motif domain-containing protein 3-like isoform X2 n=1 Tax=Pseudorasbora parva TaxID=51549 RepID=UPI00351EA5A2
MMGSHEKMLLRVILCEGDIRKITLSKKPASIDDLVASLKESLNVNFNFSLQYEDQDFDNALCNLSDISALQDRATVKIIPLLELAPVDVVETLNDSGSTAETEIPFTLTQERQTHWPNDFVVPSFSVDVEYRLRQGNLKYLNDGTFLKPSRDLKHQILEKLAESIFAFKAYPDDKDYEQVASSLVKQHPCLQESGSRSGWGGWKNSLKFKMGNFRTKMRKLGVPDVTANAGKRGANNPEGEPSRKNIKKPKKCELNFLPNYPEGHDDASLESARKELEEEMKKRAPSAFVLSQKMDLTFALRRKEMVMSAPAITNVLDRWPALFREAQIYMEFNRIAGKNLKKEFYETLDRHSACLLDIFRAKKGVAGQLLMNLLKQTKLSEPTEVRTLLLQGLPLVFGDDSPAFFRTCLISNDRSVNLDMPVGIVIVEDGMTLQPLNSLHLSPSSFGIVIEGKVVMDNLHNLPESMCLLFGLIYALHLNYPKSLKYTFEFIQRILLSMGQKDLQPKIQSLANQLFG